MSIKLLKKLVNHEIKRFYVKNKLEQKEVIFHSEGEFKVYFITPKYMTSSFQKQRRIFELKMNKNISKTKMKYLVLLYYIKELLENFNNNILWKFTAVTFRNNSFFIYCNIFMTYITF